LAIDYLFLIRHGDTKANEQGINAGPLDFPLSKKGKKEIEFEAKTLSKMKISSAYSSPVFRAVETAKILARPHKLEVKVLEDLTEAKFKTKFVGKKGREHILTTPNAFAETYQEMQDRVVKAVEGIAKKESGNAIAVSHGDVITGYLHHVVERKIGSRNRYYVLHPDPGALSVIDFKEDIPKLVLFNYHRRLFEKF